VPATAALPAMPLRVWLSACSAAMRPPSRIVAMMMQSLPSPAADVLPYWLWAAMCLEAQIGPSGIFRRSWWLALG
jgi:hypothetical protein